MQGASGYLNKQCEPEEIVRTIRTLFRGRKYITAEMMLAPNIDLTY